jgi:hypothetical protein
MELNIILDTAFDNMQGYKGRKGKAEVYSMKACTVELPILFSTGTAVAFL